MALRIVAFIVVALMAALMVVVPVVLPHLINVMMPAAVPLLRITRYRHDEDHTQVCTYVYRLSGTCTQSSTQSQKPCAHVAGSWLRICVIAIMWARGRASDVSLTSALRGQGRRRYVHVP